LVRANQTTGYRHARICALAGQRKARDAARNIEGQIRQVNAIYSWRVAHMRESAPLYPNLNSFITFGRNMDWKETTPFCGICRMTMRRPVTPSGWLL